MNTIVILGPVSHDQISAKLNLPPGWQVRFISQAPAPAPEFYENGSEAFKQLAWTWGADPLSTIAPGAERVILGSFSAGHGAMEEIFLHYLEGNPKIVGIACADSYYTSAGAPIKHGYLAYSRLAAAGKVPMLMTSSDEGGPNYPSASVAIKQIAETIGATTNDPGPPQTWGKGAWIWNYMGKLWTHKQHALTGLPDMVNYLAAYDVAVKTGTPQASQGGGIGSILPYVGVAALAFMFAGRKR